ncbi:thrombomodulin-like [Kryptolebias marmoratus]|uniref:thrombomodulin-like n=1 Tax=Kryptolebias marmoratus TaxID=37003 RepID=UPI0007F921B6|nr:thrombomodulin-like [Kryptolebias marmoratus]
MVRTQSVDQFRGRSDFRSLPLTDRMSPTTQTVFVFVFSLCGLQEAQESPPSPLGRCSGGLCLFQHLVDFPGAKEACTDFAGQLIESNSSSNDQVKALSRLTGGGSGRYWVSGSWGPNCAAALVRRGQISAVVLVPCRDELEGFACQYHPAHVCGALSGDVQYIINTTALFQLLDSDSPPPGTVALVGGAQQPASKHLCMGDWIQAPWNCEVMSGGCEHRCDPNTKTCTCPEAHGLQPNGFSCVPEGCRDGYESGEDRRSCADAKKCEEDPCTAEGKECVDVSGGYRCVCAHGFAEDDGVCVNVSICLSCEHNCSKVAGVYRCKCMEGFTVDPENPTKCKPHCPERVCPARCVRDPQLEEKNMQQCTCPDGFIVDISNGTASCVDINECEQQEMCDHRCENTFGSYRCACEDGFRLERGDRCVPLDREDKDSSGSPPPRPPPPQAPNSLQPAVFPSYIKTGSILGITVFMVLCLVLLGCLVQNMARRCGRLDLTPIKHPDLDIFYLQQVSTETYKRLSFDKQSKTDSLRL